MSTIASPRETSVPGGRRIPLISTPTSSSRPSLEHPRSTEASPSRLSSSNALPNKRNRAALREYYNLKNSATSNPNSSSTAPPPSDSSDTASIHDYPNPASPVSELDSKDFNADEYVRRVLGEQSLTELLGTYNSVLGDIRALDAERKALVYDNYSKLIVATETIGRMRGAMGKEGQEKGLDNRVEEVWRKAEGLRGVLGNVRGTNENTEKERERNKRKAVVERALECPERVRGLIGEGKTDEAKSLWEETRNVLERWKQRGVGGNDVLDCIEDGDAALRGEPAGENSWAKIRRTSKVNP